MADQSESRVQGVAASAEDASSVHRDPGVWAPRLTRLLDEQLALYRRLDEMGAEQSGLIERGETDALLRLLNKRQSVIAEITRLNAEVEPFARDWERLLSSLGADVRESLSTRLREIDELVSRIADRDEADRVSLEKRREVVSKDLGAQSRQRSAVRAYGGPASAPSGASPRFQDRKG
jgi:hypothetical protein